jgi:putative endonuclease
MTDFLSFRLCERSEAIQKTGHNMKEPAVYIMASKRNGTLYTGVTSNLPKCAWEHREGVSPGFTKRYGCKLLVWYERHDIMTSAIEREKQIMAGSRKRKLALIETLNPQWRDLYEGLM